MRETDGSQSVVELVDAERMTIGRGEEVDVAIAGDEEVSRVHAELELVGGSWVLGDDGLSRNGTFVNGERVGARRRLRDRDLIRVGGTGILFRDPGAAEAGETVPASDTDVATALTDSQRRILVALCRPFRDGESFATPATNAAIGEEVHLSVDAVKGHLRTLFERYGLGDLPQNEKRARLAEAAIRSGAVSPRDLD